MRRKRKKTGSSFWLPLASLLALSFPSVYARKQEKPAAAFAVIAGTVFRPPGLALPGASLRIEPNEKEASGTKLKRADAVTDSRGEFAVRVPAVPSKWTVHVQATGYAEQTKDVVVEGEQRYDLSLQLEPDNLKERRDAR